jgi:hypothetical protein
MCDRDLPADGGPLGHFGGKLRPGNGVYTRIGMRWRLVWRLFDLVFVRFYRTLSVHNGLLGVAWARSIALRAGRLVPAQLLMRHSSSLGIQSVLHELQLRSHRALPVQRVLPRRFRGVGLHARSPVPARRQLGMRGRRDRRVLVFLLVRRDGPPSVHQQLPCRRFDRDRCVGWLSPETPWR